MTPTLILFFSMAVMMCVGLSLIVILPWLKKNQTVNDNRLMSVNVAVFGERIAELKADKEAGLIDDKTFEIQEVELKRQLLNAQTHLHSHTVVGKKSRIIVMIWIPILAGLCYLMTSDRTPVFQLWQAQDLVGQVADDLLTGKIDTPPKWATKDSTALISAMQTNVHAHAHDPQRWLRLSELFVALEASPQALEALSRAYRLNPSDTEVAMTYAQMGFFANNGMLDGTIKNVLLETLQHTPDHEGAMMMLAMGETRAGNYTLAKAWVAKLRTNIASKSGDRSQALASLDELVRTIDAQESKVMAGVKVGVSVADSLLVKLGETDTIFITISDDKGSPPYAVKRLPIKELRDGKLQVSLSDLDAMMPNHTLSVGRESKATLLVNARISHDGNAIRQSGDFIANPVVLGDKVAVDLEISQIVP
ncbi:c-type cytochrome biogenesis protein CcmI [Moraxella oblonga]|uniref:c-type cytochrome biogenesis protein CcmI n=1 Tax=Moraxella oblonga TaxID=200413 RepID=UPI00082CFFB4|nr:c-type cytochrome biogenesis protein CcmI [Moraxella oblonga]